MIIDHTVLPLSAKELVEGVILWLWGLAVGARLAHKHVVRPARERHEELLARHDEHDRHLKALHREG